MSNPTLRRDDVSPRAKALIEEIRDVLRVEEAWAIAERYLEEERNDALQHNPLVHLADDSCRCHYDGESLVVCSQHVKEIEEGEI